MSPSGGETKPRPKRGRGPFGGEGRRNSTRTPELESEAKYQERGDTPQTVVPSQRQSEGTVAGTV